MYTNLKSKPSHFYDVAAQDLIELNMNLADGASVNNIKFLIGTFSNTTTTSTAVSSSRYKTEMCRPFEENGYCKYGNKCQFAHGKHELQNLSRHPKYKTDLCRTFHTTGLCPYGPRCNFVHSEEEQKLKALYHHPGVIQPPSRSNSIVNFGSSMDSYSSSLTSSPTTWSPACESGDIFPSTNLTTLSTNNPEYITSKNNRSDTIWSSPEFELMTPLNVQTYKQTSQQHPGVSQPLSRPISRWSSLASSIDSTYSSLTASSTALSPAYGSDDEMFSGTNIMTNFSPNDQQSFSSDSARSSPIGSSEYQWINDETHINTVNDVFSLQQQFTGMVINPKSAHENLNQHNDFDDNFLAQVFRESQSFNDAVPSMSPVDSLSEISVKSY